VETQHPKGCCVELGNWPIKVQLGSTNSKDLPALFQGSRQGFLLNNQLIHHDGSNGHAHCHPFACLQVSRIQHDAKPRLHPHPNNHHLQMSLRPCLQPCSMPLLFIPNAHPSTDASPPSTAQRRAGCHPPTRGAKSTPESIIRWVCPSCQLRNAGSASAQTLMAGCLHPHARALVQEWRQRDASSPWSSHGLMAL